MNLENPLSLFESSSCLCWLIPGELGLFDNQPELLGDEMGVLNWSDICVYILPVFVCESGFMCVLLFCVLACGLLEKVTCWVLVWLLKKVRSDRFG